MITTEQLKKIMPYSTKENRALFITPLNEAMDKYEINSPKRQAAFLAQVAHESGSLKYVEEISSGHPYEFRKDLGNLEKEAIDTAHANHSTTGRFYKGRGLFQVTGFYNYKECGAALKLPLLVHPELLKEPEYAALSAGWFWWSRRLNALADNDSFSTITRRINGGDNGAEDRNRFYAAAKIVLNEAIV